jgi:hypothetical protein
MRKLKLDVADLEVTSFDTNRAEGPRGTVAGHVTKQLTYDLNCSQESCDGPVCGPSGGNYTCADYSCVPESGCGLCATQSCEVTNC